jgi:S-adenosyl-L-methionine hydrolase (adenosine-forming)
LPLPISFLSDYGHDDEYVGVCHGVIERIAPGALVIDVAHGLPPHAVRPAAVMLRNTLPYLPAGVHIAVVDPGVGSDRRPLALRCGERLFVGPDNGLLLPAAERAGGVELAVDLSASPWRLEPVSATFHGRDVFAPVAARLALGESLDHAGEPLDPDRLAQIELPRPRISAGAVDAHVLYVDRFGNAQLDAGADEMAQAGIEVGARIEIETGGRTDAVRFVRTFADAAEGELLAYLDSYGSLALAVNRGDARARLGLGLDAAVRVLRRER